MLRVRLARSVDGSRAFVQRSDLACVRDEDVELLLVLAELFGEREATLLGRNVGSEWDNGSIVRAVNLGCLLQNFTPPGDDVYLGACMSPIPMPPPVTRATLPVRSNILAGERYSAAVWSAGAEVNDMVKASRKLLRLERGRCPDLIVMVRTKGA